MAYVPDPRIEIKLRELVSKEDYLKVLS